jgi:hypothetical protein
MQFLQSRGCQRGQNSRDGIAITSVFPVYFTLIRSPRTAAPDQLEAQAHRRLPVHTDCMPWFRIRYTPSEIKRAWIADGRPGVPPTVDHIAEYPSKEAAHDAATALRDQLGRESGSTWLWMKEVEAPSEST